MDVIDAGADLAVLSRAREGDEDAFQTLVVRHSRRVFQLAYRLTGNEHDAEDVVQESFLRVYRRLGGFQARANFSTWLYRIVVNCAVDLMRAKQGRVAASCDDFATDWTSATSPGPDPERLAESAELARRLERAVAGLTPLERAAFSLRHYEGRSIREIGSTLNLRTSAAKHAIFRAVRKLRAEFGPTCTSRKTT